MKQSTDNAEWDEGGYGGAEGYNSGSMTKVIFEGWLE